MLVLRVTGGPDADAARTATHQSLAAIQSLPEGPRLVVLTRGAVALPGEDVTDLGAAAVHGFVRSAQAEYPGRLFLVDADEDPELDRILALGESSVALRGGVPLVPRLAKAAAELAIDTPAWGDGTVLVTGGTGALGRVVARHLAAEHGVRKLLLVSHRGPAAEGAAELTGLGAKADVVACDLADTKTARKLLGRRKITGVVHSAGVVASLTPSSQHEIDIRKLSGKFGAPQFGTKPPSTWP